MLIIIITRLKTPVNTVVELNSITIHSNVNSKENAALVFFIVLISYTQI